MFQRLVDRVRVDLVRAGVKCATHRPADILRTRPAEEPALVSARL